jgi:hypothetical protein
MRLDRAYEDLDVVFEVRMKLLRRSGLARSRAAVKWNCQLASLLSKY